MMQEEKKIKFYLNFPFYLRSFALIVLGISLFVLGYSFYQYRKKPKFTMEGMPAELSKEVVAVAYNYERIEIENGRNKYLVKASKATTFTDNHQELENVYIEVYDESGQNKDILSANYAVYFPTAEKNFKAFFFGSVKVETRDSLSVKTEKLSYDRATELAETEGETEFSRQQISGKSQKVKVWVAKNEAELFDNVQINLEGNQNQKVAIRSEYAKLEAGAERVTFENNVVVNFQSSEENYNFQGTRLICFLSEKQLKSIELTGKAEVVNTRGEKRILKAEADFLKADVIGDIKRVYLRGNSKVEAFDSNGNPVFSSADSIIYDQTVRKLFLEGNAEISQHGSEGKTLLKGNKIQADFFSDNHIKGASLRERAYLKHETTDKIVEASALQMDVSYSESRKIRQASASGNANVVVTPLEAKSYSKASVSAPRAIRFSFQNNALSQIQTEGRTTIFLAALAGVDNSSNRKLTADKIKTFLDDKGKNLLRVEAIGNVVVEIEPVKRSDENYKTTIVSEQMDCDFYEGNNMKSCLAFKNAKAIQERFFDGGQRILTADKFFLEFEPVTQQASKYEASGRARYSEGDRNGIANQITLTEPDRIVRLRGGEPTIWDSKARAKAGQIDWDTKQQRSFLHQKVSTTYYNQRQSDGTLPFANPSAPVYITADSAEFNHRDEIGIYMGNARAWQENNYIRAEKLVLHARQRSLLAEGKVQTLIYKIEKENKSKQPVFVSSDKMTYQDENRLVRYDGSVDIRQGTDRIISESAEIFLTEQNEVAKAIARGNVRLSQPNRQASGDYIEYGKDEIVVLRGFPAKVIDAQQGELQGSQILLNLKENRVTSEGKSSTTSSGRNRSIYKVKN
ncbi:MAG: LPS export ABC transporter periplasmic protein LptC [Pyrinomonadaceae bacterium]|nr:LPS export ABC transporter periplasmic protein LptC [Pyrinomonadaceae bacterium]MCX7639635.1 LPS export ABC transporter periplasmic protein LptC [Pyrinomonadaceae bacterium]MDW8303347.1 LPS export ABC transporter periplasmic protein LptC [Acidobacteriota bacterium]